MDDDFVVQFHRKSFFLLVFIVGILFHITISICEGLRPRVKHIYNKNFSPVDYLHASKSALS